MKHIAIPLLASILLLFIFLLDPAVAQEGSVPQMINYQGMLTDAKGDPLDTAEYTLAFTIFDAATDGIAVWGPKTMTNVPVVRGQFNIILGPKDDANRDIIGAFISSGVFLEVKVGEGQPIAPRQQILSAPYALRSDNGAPVGSIMAFHNFAGKINIPDGWQECNGEPVEDKNRRLRPFC